MAFFQTKIPLLSQDWTLARGIGCLAKLCVFIFLPGLHQFACNRKKLGTLLLGVFLIAGYIFTNSPSGFLASSYFGVWQPLYVMAAMEIVSWLLILIDFGNLPRRKLKLWFALPAASIVLLYFVPLHDRDLPDYLIQADNSVCPVYCKNDIIAYRWKSPRRNKIAVGSHIVVRDYEAKYNYVGKVLVCRLRESCETGQVKLLPQPSGHPLCDKRRLEPIDEYLVVGGLKSDLQTLDGRNISRIEEYHIRGVKLINVGNTHAHYVLNDEITDIVGNALLTIFKWTGLNFLGLSKDFKYIELPKMRKRSAGKE